MIGSEIGNYRILEKLGEGGMGVVYKAVDTSLDRVVAIKVLNSDLARVPELVARFRGEAKAQANLNHTNLATLYAFLTMEGSAMMVMEFVDGETFAQMIHRRGPLPSQGAVPMFRQALLGIGFAHRAGIVHRDIKPSNLMLNHQGIVKVMDFGIAKVMGERGLTRTGMQVGTCRYMSPEQVLNKPADIRSDIYALGITLYEMLTANTPFQSDSEFQIMSDHVHTPPPPPTKFYPYIPKGVENVILRALAKNPDERFQTVEEFGAALEHPDDYGVGAASMPGVGVGPQIIPPIPSGPPHMTAPPLPGSVGAATATMPAGAPSPTQVQTPIPQYQTPAPYPAPPPYQTPPGGYQTPPPQYQTPPPQYPTQPPVPAPVPPPKKSSAAAVLIAVIAVVCIVGLAVGGWLVFQPKPPRPVPTPIVGQVTPQQALTSSPNAQQVNIDMGNNAATGLQIQAFEFSANPVRAGQQVTLSWSVPGAAEVNISPAIGTVPAQGSKVISTRADTVFTLTAKTASGQTVSRTLNLLVDNSANQRQAPTQQEARSTPQPPPQPPPQQYQPPPQQPPPQQQYQPPPQQQYQPPQQEQYRPQQQPPPQQQMRASPIMAVYHDHGLVGANQYTWPSCWGQLQIGGGKVVYHVLGTADGRRDDFVVAVSAVDEVKVNRMPIRGRQAFHMRINGQNFNFVPAAGSPVFFVNTINQWLQAK